MKNQNPKNVVVQRGNQTQRTKPVLPTGTFRTNPYYKTIYTSGANQEYQFDFTICHEYNYLDNGAGGTCGTGYFIHINAAPYFGSISNQLHEFHMIKTQNGYHICWNELITSFKEANAVMFVWAKNYTKLIDLYNKNNGNIKNFKLQSRNTNILPTGTFRTKQLKKQIKKYKVKDTVVKKIKEIRMTEKIHNEILSILGTRKPELGGMLGYDEYGNVSTFVFDEAAKVNQVEYNPNTEYLNQIISEEWPDKNITLAGFVHSHPGNYNKLSYADVEYAQRITQAFNIPYLVMPLVTSSFESKTKIYPYIVTQEGEIEEAKLVILQEEYDIDLINEMQNKFNKITDNPLNQDDIFARVRPVIDIDHMKECTVIGIGCGGSRSFYESMARLGVGKFILIDGDKSSLSNITSQNGFISEEGQYKPELIKERLLNIDNTIEVTAYNTMLDDTLDDEWFEKNILNEIEKDKSIICAFTDDFYAQARITKLSLKYNIALISGEHHPKGETSEVTYYYPGISYYSREEICSTRYEEYQNGYINNVTSVGSPIFNTTRLNAICEKIALGILLYSSNKDNIYSSFLNKNKDKNLLLIRQNFLDDSNGIYNLFFKQQANTFFDDIVWLNPKEIIGDVEVNRVDIIDTRNIF